MSKKSIGIILLTSAVAIFFGVQVLGKQPQISETASESKHKYIIPIYPSASDYYHRGLKRYDCKDYRGAVSDYDKALELNPNYFDAYVERGFAEIRLEKYRRVVSDFSAALGLRPHDDSSYWFLAMRADSHYWLGQYPEAVADYTKAIELTPDNKYRALFYRLRGLNLVQLGDRQALSDFKRSLELDPVGNACFLVRDLPSLLMRIESSKKEPRVEKQLDL